MCITSSIHNHPSIILLLLFPTLLHAKQMSYKKVEPNITLQLSRYGYAGMIFTDLFF